MPKNNKPNSKGGKKHKRFKKQGKGAEEAAKTYFITKDDDTEYGVITKVLGDKRFLCKLKSFNKKYNDKEILVRVPKKFKRKRWFVNTNDYVLVGMREYQENKGDIIYLYDNKEVRKLIKMKELSTTHVHGEVEKVDAFVLDDYEEAEEDDLMSNKKKIPAQPYKDFDLKDLDSSSDEKPDESFTFDDL